MKQRIKVIGITGGIASGKSTIAEMLKSSGADLIDADKICHELINTKDIALEITKRWGSHLLDNHGKIKRDVLAEIVFSDRKEVSALNRIVHPKAIKQIKSKIAELHAKTSTKAIVLDAALLVESNLIDICDIVLFVDTEKNRCKTRVLNSRNWPLDEIAKREKFQGLIPQKREISDVIINNNHSKEDTLNQVKDFWCQFITKK
ncbi:MAG: dephospho-CoA kinase [Candidatus Scalindua rubra]|uniref:Dephospho-CoA kinase n=1 Tax=Candidatus Scalindua brodae TaxID=237368 RepID=A0A0B0ETK5_9BACT|nr:MAG: dephospho-CoA kinase [Candidatus Scalindua brodae]MBZ0108954.1 dephospho-CoA kinase [Candidatus Scalindua rubra]TWU32147.1 Dephospho-CoA kinase [Candidatus Brocadiaceae bacterium S225]